MKLVSLLLLLAPVAAPAAERELVCDPAARITFPYSIFTGNSVEVETPSGHFRFSRDGKDILNSGLALRSLPGAPEELVGLADGSVFFTYGNAEQTVFVDRNLLRGVEDDGIVVARSPASSKIQVFHCRSR